MKTYTVNELARLAGVTVRTLHHYDEIGLLKPAFTGENRYRYYGEDELLRLQQILIHRELDIPLAEIGAILDAPGFDRLETLQKQRSRLEEQARRYAGMVRTIDRTIARLKGERTMKDADLYSGIVSPEKQAEYEAWLSQTYGPEMDAAIADSREALAGLGPDGMRQAMKGLEAIEAGLVEAMKRGVLAESKALDPLMARHRDWVAMMWGRPCPPEAFAGLADLHLSHPDFVDRYEALATGFAEYHAAAMKAWASRQSS